MPNPLTAALAWHANSESDLAGYRVYYGPSPGVYTQQVDVGMTASPATPAFTVVGRALTNTTTQPWPAPGRWWFVVTAYNTSNMESPVSNEVTKAISAEYLHAARMG